MSNLITFSSSDIEAIEIFPPVPAGKVIPDWYKNTPVEVPEISEYTKPHTPTVKRCIPVLDYLTSGYIIRATYEVQIKKFVDEDKFNSFDYRCRNTDIHIGKHPWHQAHFEINGEKSHYLKVNQPWKIKTPPGYSCLFYDPYYEMRSTFSLFPGIVDTDFHDEPVGLVGMVKESEFTIKPGDPLVVVFPFKREDWKMNVVPSTQEKEWADSSFKYRLNTCWSGIYQKLFHQKKSYK